MQIAGDFSFLFSSPKGISTLSLQAGETVRALVKDVTAQEVVLLIRGQAIQARTETALEPGQKVSLMVQEIGEGRIVFQLVAREQGEVGGQVDGKVSAETLLARYGLPTTSGNLLLAQALILSGTRGNSREALQLLSKLLSPNPNLAEAQALLYLCSTGKSLGNSHRLPLQTFMQAFGSGNNPTITRIGDWQSLMKGFAALPEISSLLEELSIGLGEPNIADKLAYLQERLGLDHEARIQLSTWQSGLQDTKRDPTVKETILSLLQSQASEIAHSPETIQGARTLLHLLTGLQLLHVGPGDQGQLYLMGWLNWHGTVKEQSPFFLSFFQDEGGGQGPGEPSRQVMLKTNTPRLGHIMAEMRFYGKQMSIGVAVQNLEAQQAFNKYTNKLLEMMEGLPWKVQVLPCRLVTEEKERNQWLQKYVAPITTQRLDVRL